MVDRCSRKQQFPQLQARTGEADFGWEAAAAVAEVAAVGARVSGAGLRRYDYRNREHQHVGSRSKW